MGEGIIQVFMEYSQTAGLRTRSVGTFGTASTETATVPKRRG